MSSETINFIAGWLAGLIPSILTVYLGYRIQIRIEDRRRKYDIVKQRLDQAEEFIDLVLEYSLEFGDFFSTLQINKVNDKRLKEKIDAVNLKSNIFSIIGDEKLGDLAMEYTGLVDFQDALLKSLASAKTSTQFQSKKKSLISKEIKLHNLFLRWAANSKKRIDFIRASSTDKFFRKDLSKVSWQEEDLELKGLD